METLADSVTLYLGDCIETLAQMESASVDSVVCDPPYGLEFMGVAWDSFSTRKGKPRTRNEWADFGSREHAREASQSARIQRNKGLAFQKFSEAWAREVLRVMKPGAHLVAFGGTRTFHRMMVAIEDAGFELRDTLMWVYGSGFPKSHDVSKAIDRKAGAMREVLGRSNRAIGPSQIQNKPFARGISLETQGLLTVPATADAAQWQGFGTALKPAFEPIILARKPLGPGMTVAANVLKYGTGAINVDGCRVESDSRPARSNERSASSLTDRGGAVTYGKFAVRGSIAVGETRLGRWPANLVHDGSDEVLAGFPQCNGAASNGRKGVQGIFQDGLAPQQQVAGYSDSGSAARFFYCAKASKKERAGSKHPTVKPVALMQWLVRLVTPRGGIVLDPFAGTGTTGEAARREGFRAILIEREPEYQADIRRRFTDAFDQPEQSDQPDLFIECPKPAKQEAFL